MEESLGFRGTPGFLWHLHVIGAPPESKGTPEIMGEVSAFVGDAVESLRGWGTSEGLWKHSWGLEECFLGPHTHVWGDGW